MMAQIQHRYFLLIIMVFVTSVFVNILGYNPFYKQNKGTDAVKKIPKIINKWQGYDIILKEKIYNILETRAIVHRIYRSGERRVFLSLIYYPETKVDFHTPEACLAGKGIAIKKRVRTIVLTNKKKDLKFKVNALLLKNNGSRLLIYYFYKCGDFLDNSYFKLRFKLAGTKLIGRSKSGVLIRVSTPMVSDEYSSQVLSEFITDLYPYIMEYL